jgi:hypothetical protein
MLRDVAKSIAEQTDVENVMEELARLCAVVLLAQKRCSQG